jgi:large subunit ribosomal protein L10
LPLRIKEKKTIVEDLHEKFSRSATVIMARFPGLDVADANELRKKLRESGAEFKVSKNTLFRRAIQGTPAEVLSDQFSGPNAVAFTPGDPVSMAKVIVEFAKENEILEIRSGVLNGKLIDVAQIQALSELPGREVLLAKLLAVFAAVPTCLVRALSGIPRKLLYALRAIEDQKE